MSNSDRARTWDYYLAGYTVDETVRKTSIDKEYVNDLFFEWSVIRAKEKRIADEKKAEEDRKVKMEIPTFSAEVTEFHLHAPKQDVWEAWLKLKRGWRIKKEAA